VNKNRATICNNNAANEAKTGLIGRASEEKHSRAHRTTAAMGVVQANIVERTQMRGTNTPRIRHKRFFDRPRTLSLQST
jgi:hypothetical protein